MMGSDAAHGLHGKGHRLTFPPKEKFNSQKVSTHSGKASVKIRLDNGGWQSLKWAEKQVNRGRARWAAPGVLHMIRPDEQSRPVERPIPAEPKLMWPAWYKTSCAPASMFDERYQSLHGVTRYHEDQTTRKGEWYTCHGRLHYGVRKPA